MLVGRRWRGAQRSQKILFEGAALGCCVALGCASGHVIEGHAISEAVGEVHVAAPEPPSPQARTPTVITISAVGDCAIGDLHYGAGAPGSFAARLAEVDDPIGYPFSGIGDVFHRDDLTIANLEGTFTTREAWHNPVFSIRGKPSYAAMLKRGGVDLVDIDNNHADDYGPDGHEDTKRALDDAGVSYFGRKIVDRRDIKGMTIVNLGYLGGPAGTRERVVRDIKRERKPGTIVIASFHWGIEAFYATAPDQTRLGRAAIDAGADLVLGHHPHVLQAIETYKGRHIVYSLGNFVFGANSQPKDTDSIIYQERFTIEDGAVTAFDNAVIPVAISSSRSQNDFRPVLLSGDEAARVEQKIAKLNQKL